MNTTTFIVLTALGASLAYYIVMLAIRIRSNVRIGQSFHDSLISEISHMRMGKMMDALGISKTKYIHQESVLDINHQIDNCKACDNTIECDEKIASNDIVVENIHFCDNEESMVNLVFKQNEKEEHLP